MPHVARSVAIAVFLFAASVSQATVLSFQNAAGGDLAGTYLWGLPGYGDNITSSPQGAYSYPLTHGTTPNVALTHTQNGHGASLWIDFGTVTKGAVPSSLILTADAGYTVSLHGFDVFAPARGGYGFNYLRVIVDNTQAWSQSNTGYPVGTTVYNEGDEWTAGLFKGSEIRLEWLDDGLGASYDAGIDNVAFSQALVPEPAALSLLVGALLAVPRRPRRKHA